MKNLVTDYWWSILLITIIIGDWIRKTFLVQKNKRLVLEQVDEIKKITHSHPIPFIPYFDTEHKYFQIKALADNKVLVETLGTVLCDSSDYNIAKWYQSKDFPTKLLSVGATFKVIQTVSGSCTHFSFQEGPHKKNNN